MVGFAVTEVPVVALKPVDGNQVYVAAPLAVNVPLWPLQRVRLFTETLGEFEIVIVCVSVLVPLELLTVKVTVYVPAEA